MSRRRPSPSSACRFLVSLTLALPSSLAAQFSDREIGARTEAITPALVEIRHDLHRHPELGNRETRTAGIVAERLKKLGLEVRTGVAVTGVVGLLRGGRAGPVVAVRADMDALPVTEASDLPFRSTARTTYLGRETGVSHACGHDIHVAVALGVAEVLSARRRELPGTVVFIFQPAEEGVPPGEQGGARLMVREGVLRDPRPDVILALHANGDPPEEVGDFERLGFLSYTPGPQQASSTTWRARVRGSQTHGATPHLGIDAIVTASAVVQALQTIRSRTLSPFEPAVVTVGVFRAGDRHNIIAGEAELQGTIRTFGDSLTDLIKTRMRGLFDGVTRSADASYELEFDESYPVTVNDSALAARFGPVLRRVVGEENVAIAPPETVAEDFSYFAREVPGFYFKLGAVPPGETSGGHHTSTFRADDGAIPVGVRGMAALVVDYLRRPAVR